MSFGLFLKQKIIGSKWLKIVSFCCLPVYVYLCIVFLEYLNYGTVHSMMGYWGTDLPRVLFSMLVMSLISVILLAICRKLWIYAVVFAVPVVLAGITNCVKTAANGDHFVPWDITMAGKLGDLVGFAKFNLPFYTLPLLLVIACFCVMFALSRAEIPVKWYIRLPAAAAIASLFIICYNLPSFSEKLLTKFKLTLNDSIIQSTNYRKNGFVNAFTINCLALKVVPPEGYSQQTVERLIENYKGSAQSGKSPDIIVVLSEAFFDVRTLEGTSFSKNPLENFDNIAARKNAYTGKMYTTAYGGGTVRTEFEVLTGLTIDYLINGTSPYLYITQPTESAVSVLKSQGYATTAVHSYDKTFYMRNDAYPDIGFDEFIAEDSMRDREDLSRWRGYISDDTLVNVMTETLDAKKDKPNFMFAITMENHGLYDEKLPEDKIDIEVKSDRLSPDILDAVTTYTQGVSHADAALGKLVDYIDSRERDTLLLFFGDHLPALGSYYAAYDQSGNIDGDDGIDEEELKFIYSAPFMFYANYDVDYSVLGENHDVSTYYLMPLMAKIAGTGTTPYMEYLLDNFQSLPYCNVRLQMELNEPQKEYINSLKLLTYDRVKGKRYSLKSD